MNHDGITVGSRWETKDWRESGRVVVVEDLDVRYAYCRNQHGRRQTRILRTQLLRRFRKAEGEK